MATLQKRGAANGDKLFPLQLHLFHWTVPLAAARMLERDLETRQKGPSPPCSAKTWRSRLFYDKDLIS